LSAYFDGDGNVSVQRKCIRASSKSKELIDGMAVLLNRFGIFCTKRASPTEHRLSISAKYAPLFKEKIGFKTPKKSSLLSQLCALPKARFAYDVVDKTTGFGTAISEIATSLKIPSRYVNKFTQKQEIGRQTLHKYVQLFEEKARTQKVDITAQIAALRQLLEEDIVWDEITSIRKVNPSKYVYDFAVEGLETFTTFDGIITHNTLRTFHYAGVASLAQLGFTRLVELVDGRKTPKKPVMEIHLKKSYAGNWEKAKAVAASIEQVTLDKVAKIEENFNRKAVTITLDRTQLREKEIKEPDILAKVKEACGEYEPDKDANVIHIKPKNDSLRNIRKLTNKLSEIHLMGIPGINRAILVEQEENGKKSYTLATEGSNLKEVFKVEEVDAEKTTTNDIMEIAETLGIEAARNAIVLETMKVLDAQGLKVDVRHIMLIADAMTAKGEVQSVGRHGLAGNKASVLARAAFEETSKHLVNAALTSEEDNLNGIIENIIAGQIIPCGTGKVKLTMEADYLS
ncbi:intein-containing DNA-directed RNA polymerase subunit A'', partial [Candidatus Micrarchaeota archaeon]|nr:intein-containing DNA-directed RNA polymerase subunit A'' [Candidatus Micrarchaeota archaeon]